MINRHALELRRVPADIKPKSRILGTNIASKIFDFVPASDGTADSGTDRPLKTSASDGAPVFGENACVRFNSLR